MATPTSFVAKHLLLMLKTTLASLNSRGRDCSDNGAGQMVVKVMDEVREPTTPSKVGSHGPVIDT